MDAKVSGVYFPAELSADEIRLSLTTAPGCVTPRADWS